MSPFSQNPTTLNTSSMFAPPSETHLNETDETWWVLLTFVFDLQHGDDVCPLPTNTTSNPAAFILSVRVGRCLGTDGAHRPRPHHQHRRWPSQRSKCAASERRHQQVQIMVVTSHHFLRHWRIFGIWLDELTVLLLVIWNIFFQFSSVFQIVLADFCVCDVSSVVGWQRVRTWSTSSRWLTTARAWLRARGRSSAVGDGGSSSPTLWPTWTGRWALVLWHSTGHVTGCSASGQEHLFTFWLTNLSMWMFEIPLLLLLS